MFAGHDQLVFDLLATTRRVAPATLDTLWAEHQATGQPLATLLVESGALNLPGLLEAVAAGLGFACRLDLPTTLPAESAAPIYATLARNYGAIPIEVTSSGVALAVTDPFRPDLGEAFALALGETARVVVADPTLVQRLLDRNYGSRELVSPNPVLPPDSGSMDVSPADLAGLAGQPPVIQWVNDLLVQAIRGKASDLHFEPFEREFKVRCRIDGVLRELPPPPRQLAAPVISRLKVMANLNIAERRAPQDGRIRINLAGRSVDLRIATLPTQFGESVVLRVLDQSAVRLELEQLGLPPAIFAALSQSLDRPSGIFLVTGPTGSGKTTTLYGCLQRLNIAESKLLTVEDPVEYNLDGIMQVPVNLGAGLTFARALRAFLRQDPDIVMVGEIRDSETAQIAIQAALTGHLVLATLHTNDAPGAITRLIDLGIEPFLLASTLNAVLAQRLVRRLCPVCRTPFVPGRALQDQLDPSTAMHTERPWYTARGCHSCQDSGYLGRLGLFEYFAMTDALSELVVSGASLAQLRHHALAAGLTTLRTAGVAAILAGDTTADEVLKYT